MHGEQDMVVASNMWCVVVGNIRGGIWCNGGSLTEVLYSMVGSGSRADRCITGNGLNLLRVQILLLFVIA